MVILEHYFPLSDSGKRMGRGLQRELQRRWRRRRRLASRLQEPPESKLQGVTKLLLAGFLPYHLPALIPRFFSYLLIAIDSTLTPFLLMSSLIQSIHFAFISFSNSIHHNTHLSWSHTQIHMILFSIIFAFCLSLNFRFIYFRAIISLMMWCLLVLFCFFIVFCVLTVLLVQYFADIFNDAYYILICRANINMILLLNWTGE